METVALIIVKKPGNTNTMEMVRKSIDLPISFIRFMKLKIMAMKLSLPNAVRIKHMSGMMMRANIFSTIPVKSAHAHVKTWVMVLNINSMNPELSQQ